MRVHFIHSFGKSDICYLFNCTVWEYAQGVMIAWSLPISSRVSSPRGFGRISIFSHGSPPLRGSLEFAAAPSLGPLGCSFPPPFPLFFFLRGILLPPGSTQPPPPSADSTSGLLPAWWELASLSELLPSLLLPPSGVGFRLLLPLFVVSVMTDDPGSNPRIFSNCNAADLTLSVFPEIIYFVADLGPSVRKQPKK